MGVSFSVIFKKKVPPYGTLGPDHVALANGYEKLDKAASKQKLPTLGPFLSADPDELRAMAEDLGADPEELEGPELSPEQWFDAADGLSAVRALVEFLKRQPTAVPQSTQLRDDLTAIETELTKAASSKVKFHFQLVM
jgi:hypothetical protein